MIRLFFKKDGALFLEFDLVFHDLFNGRRVISKKILELLIDGGKSIEAIAENNLEIEDGELLEVLEQLEISGFIRKSGLWSIGSGLGIDLFIYSIDDCFVRFYLKYVEPKREIIKKELMEYSSLGDLQGWSSMKGFQLEALLLQNRDLIYDALRIPKSSIINAGPFIQRKSNIVEGCQIDFLIQTKDCVLYVCEFKFGLKKIGLEVAREVLEKAGRLSLPVGYVTMPVLFHFGEVDKAVRNSGCFFKIIDLLEMCAEEDEY
jgi:hypothetical protein